MSGLEPAPKASAALRAALLDAACSPDTLDDGDCDASVRCRCQIAGRDTTEERQCRMRENTADRANKTRQTTETILRQHSRDTRNAPGPG
eukprot:2230893-Rhodomonas_salina.1